MSERIRFVANKSTFKPVLLKQVVQPVMDDVQEQMEGMAEVHPSITVYRNEDSDRSNVVATCPAPVERAHGVLSQMLSKVVV